MHPGDQVLVYHTGDERAVVGTAEVVSAPYPDPGNRKLVLVDVAPRGRLARAVTLAQIKARHEFAEWELVRISRLSVMPVPDAHWRRIMEMAAAGAADS